MRSFAFLFLAIVLAGCNATVTPKPIVSNEASFDGSDQDSGIIVAVPGGWYITPERLANYNSLIDRYSSQFDPPLKHNDGVRMEGPNIFIDDEHDVDQKMMKSWKKMGTHQPQTLLQKAGL